MAKLLIVVSHPFAGAYTFGMVKKKLYCVQIR